MLVVCLGNVCRSPVAERLLAMRLRGLLDDAGDQNDPGDQLDPSAPGHLVTGSSAGVRALVGHPIDAHAAEELTRLGGDPSGFAATQLTPQMVEAADLVLTATSELRSRTLEEAPRALRRTFTLREFATFAAGQTGARGDGLRGLVTRAAANRSEISPGDYDVPDPFGASPEVHREVAELLDRSCLTIASAVAGALTGA